MRFPLGLLVAAAFTFAAVGCGKDDTPADAESDQGELGSPGTSSGANGSSGASGSSGAACTATFVWLQKDAYKETGGRTTALWPPHTTTTLEVKCGDETVASAFMANHGSEPGSKDANGRDFLDEARRLELTGSRADLEALVETYKGCECEPTSFLSMNSLDQSLVSDLLEKFTTLVNEQVTCEDGAETDLVAALQAQDFVTALAIVPTCTWPGPDGNPAQTLTEALQTVLATTGGALDAYHVCNNDAKLQADLVEAFQKGTAPAACDRTTTVCQGPLWLYDPNEAPAGVGSDQ